MPFSLYLYRGNDMEGELADLLENTRRRQALMREYILLGYLCSKQGLKLDPSQQAIQGMLTNQLDVAPAALPVRAPPASTQLSGNQSEKPAEAATESTEAASAQQGTGSSLRRKYGGLT